MKPFPQINQLKIAAYVHAHYRRHSINVAVTLYSHNQFVSKDVDLVYIAFT